MDYLTAYRRQARKARAEIDRKVKAMTKAQRDGWYALVEQYEHFDGETEIELGFLNRYLAQPGAK